MTSPTVLERALRTHSAAAKETLERAERVSDEQWRLPTGEGKWSSAEIVAHLCSTYRIVIAELDGGEGMQIRVPTIRRWILRLTILPGIMRGRGFPRGAVAPRETRPAEILGRDESISLFRKLAEEFEAAARKAPPDRKLTHAYFGSAAVPDGVLLCARHVEHHARQLPDA